MEILQVTQELNSLLLCKIIFVSVLWIFGFHAITRKDKLLSFLALRLKGSDLLSNESFVKNSSKDEIKNLIKKVKKQESSFFWKNFGSYLSEPFSECLVCMSSFWGFFWTLIFCFKISEFPTFWIFVIPVIIAGMIEIIIRIANKDNSDIVNAINEIEW